MSRAEYDYVRESMWAYLEMRHPSNSLKWVLGVIRKGGYVQVALRAILEEGIRMRQHGSVQFGALLQQLGVEDETRLGRVHHTMPLAVFAPEDGDLVAYWKPAQPVRHYWIEEIQPVLVNRRGRPIRLAWKVWSHPLVGTDELCVTDSGPSWPGFQQRLAGVDALRVVVSASPDLSVADSSVSVEIIAE